jgi:hypothetical protein
VDALIRAPGWLGTGAPSLGLCLALSLALGMHAPCAAQVPPVAKLDVRRDESQIKAAFLYKFTAYVDWPDGAFATADAPLTIGVIGADALATELEQVVAGRKVNDRLVAVRRLKPDDPLKGVQIVFIGQGTSMHLRPSPGLLVVTEAEAALTQGSVINFVLVDRRVRFEIALDAAEKNGLRLSSRLLAVAEKVVTGAP